MDISTVLVLIWCSTRTKGGPQRKKLLLLVFWALPKLEGGGSPFALDESILLCTIWAAVKRVTKSA